MPRMRLAIRSGWKTSNSVSASPLEANMIGLPVARAMDSAAPPRASPSSLVSTTPSKPTPSAKAFAVLTASWPIIASTTNRTSSGETASRMSAACCIRSASMPSRPAVSTTTTSKRRRCASAIERLGDGDGVADAVAGLGREHLDPGPLADDLQLVDRVRALEVGGDEQRRAALRLEPERELAGQRRLAGALEAGEHDHRRRVLGEPDGAGVAAEDRDELLVDDLDDRLRRVERAGQLGALGPLADPRDEVADDREVDVGLEQRDPDLPRGRVDVGLAQPRLAAQVLERRGQAVGEGVEHGSQPTQGVAALVRLRRVRLVTFNVLHGASPDDGLVDLDRFARAVVALDPDVLALQEVDRGQERSHGADLAAVAAEAMGAATTRFVAAMTGDPRRRWRPASRTLGPDAPAYGVALLSRYPLVGWRDLHLPRIAPPVPRVRRDPRRLELAREELRTAVVARLETPEGPLVVASAHLSFFPGWNQLQLYALRRALTAAAGAVPRC